MRSREHVADWPVCVMCRRWSSRQPLRCVELMKRLCVWERQMGVRASRAKAAMRDCSGAALVHGARVWMEMMGQLWMSARCLRSRAGWTPEDLDLDLGHRERRWERGGLGMAAMLRMRSVHRWMNRVAMAAMRGCSGAALVLQVSQEGRCLPAMRA